MSVFALQALVFLQLSYFHKAIGFSYYVQASLEYAIERQNILEEVS